MLGEFFAASETEIDDELLEAPYEQLPTVEAKGLTDVSLATLGEILGVASYDDLVGRFPATGSAANEDVGAFQLPTDLRDALANLEDVELAARRWAETEELRLDEWQVDDTRRVLADVSVLARRARDEQRELWYWWSL